MLVLLCPCLYLLAVSAPPAAPAAPQDPPAVLAPQAPRAPLDRLTHDALLRLSRQITTARQGVEAARGRGDATALRGAEDALRELEWQFASLASGIEVKEFERPGGGSAFELQKEIADLIRPLIQSLKDATAVPRQVAELKDRIAELQQRQRTAEQALRGAERTRDALPAGDAARAEVERELEQRWRPAVDALRGEVLVLEARLQARLQNQRSLLEHLRDAGPGFLQTSGLSLLLAGLVFAGVYAGWRWLQNRALRPWQRTGAFAVRLVAVVLHLLGIGLALGAMLLVPWLRNDWVLLAIGIVFLLGVGWVAMRTLPQFVEQIRLVLNVGAVREGERLVLDGLPFRVDALRFHSRLDNPALQGGTLRMPLQELVGKRSRPSGPDEPWFPCRVGDVVQLADGVLGTVRVQTPDVVVVEDALAAPRSYPTREFLRLVPRNLSAGFVVEATLGLDHRHAEAAAAELPAQLTADLAAALPTTLPPELAATVRVQFARSGPLAIDVTAFAAFTGGAAARHHELRRLVHRELLAACQRRGLVLARSAVVDLGAG
jgi:hypothetical protein